MNTIKIFLDTEFTSLTQKAELISLALVTETGKKFYAIFTDFDKENLHPFVCENVLPYIEIKDENTVSGSKEHIKTALKKWLESFRGQRIEMWADVPHYDWVLFCELFGGSVNLPENISYMCMDLATLLYAKGIEPGIDRKEFVNQTIFSQQPKHNALYDAELSLACYKKLINL